MNPIIGKLLTGAVLSAVLAATAPAPVASAAASGPRRDTVTYTLTGSAEARTWQTELRCDDRSHARARLVPKRPGQTRVHHVAGRTCTVATSTSRRAGWVDEVTITVRQADEVLARRVLYSHDGLARSTDFVVPKGELHVDIAVTQLPQDRVGTPLRLMQFNIWRSGLLDGLAGPEGGQENLRQLVEYVRSEDPDVLFLVETYGSGEAIVEGLNEGLPPERRYQGVQVTREPGQAPDEDNLWLVTRLPVETIYPRESGGDLTSFNFGGARLRLPDGQHIHAFATWLHHTDSAWNPTNQSALENVLGLSRTYTDEQILAADARRRIGMATTLLRERLPGYIGDDEAPVFLGGDFNTLSHLDWSERFADAPGHGGLVLDWPVMRMFDEAGFLDTYRFANPDAARYPGRTWSPYAGFGFAPGRIDYILAKGDAVRVLGSRTRTVRLEEHLDSPLVDLFPFYSDHGALITDVVVRGVGPGPRPGEEPARDEPEDIGEITWPAPPEGQPVPPAELSATASTENANGEAHRAVDGDLRTHWHSQYSPEVTPLPHELTIDMQRVRTLRAVRYQPRIVGNLNGTILRARVEVSEDGQTYQEVAQVNWARNSLPKDIDLQGVRARYLRFHVELGIGGFSSAAEITPYVEPDES